MASANAPLSTKTRTIDGLSIRYAESEPRDVSAIQDPGADQVRIRVEACGVCHSDSATVDAMLPGSTYPRVPGHEVVGHIDSMGSGVRSWQVGQRVGIGFLGGYCGYCEFCRAGDLVNCRNQEFTGVKHDGGYAEVMIAKASGLVSIPDDLSSADAAPLLCAGITTFSALRNAPPKAGDLLAVLGIGRGGQWCTSPGYAYVHESVADAFVAEAKRALVALYGKDPKSNPDYSRNNQSPQGLAARRFDRSLKSLDRRGVRSRHPIPCADNPLSRDLGRSPHEGRNLRTNSPDIDVPVVGRSFWKHHRSSASPRGVHFSAAIRRKSTGEAWSELCFQALLRGKTRGQDRFPAIY
jgi:Alcohol dehydrogenase GroES-like domain